MRGTEWATKAKNANVDVESDRNYSPSREKQGTAWFSPQVSLKQKLWWEVLLRAAAAENLQWHPSGSSQSELAL